MYIPKATHKGSVLLVLLDIAVVACAPFLASAIRFFHSGDPFHGVFKHPYGFIVAGLIYLFLDGSFFKECILRRKRCIWSECCVGFYPWICRQVSIFGTKQQDLFQSGSPWGEFAGAVYQGVS